MIELVLAVIMIVAMAKIASADDLSPILWGVVAFVFCFLCMFIPFPFARILIAAVLTFAAMTVYKMAKK